MLDTPKANRLHIAIFGKRNAGKSSLINALTGQEMALVSDMAGTTTDPVYKAMELLPIGPVVIIDTAGLDDVGELGELRVKKSKEVMEKTDLALLVFDSTDEDYSFEKEWHSRLRDKKIPTIGVINKIDIKDKELESYEKEFDMPFVKVSAADRINIDKLKRAIQLHAPEGFEAETIVGDILPQKALVVLVAPQDIQAPKGRLILPQVQTIRDLLDHDAMALTVKDAELEDLLSSLNRKPDLVITDSQIFGKISKIIPREIPLTSFSILMARYKGDLAELIEGAKQIGRLKSGDKVLIAEACTHHSLEGDIGREKLPKWLREYSGAELDITIKAGVDFSDDLSQYAIVVHCGACMFNKKQMMSRLERTRNDNVPITNYGVAIAYMNGILERVTEMFF
ncbi:GTP-binding protein [Peptoclostridium acidaminophilum DSM 3953]|uniref:GTP-binding protein n=1 Tax=Peptoclostridium acidaminophilum DSM 3953 TaxID=1286171 RepID=W8T1X0_PEPAC|nr:[FeFe] hydrogenase H-cluster maturation GTPase HydF [Peptoclostridium acidaminophilum]AHM55724.1 GTP-binding protein [Peptoclostridium acidaminophilum DSM 3953]